MSAKPDLSMSFWNDRKSRIKKKILEEAQVGGKHLMYRGAKIRITSNFSLETMQARKTVEWSISHLCTTSLKLSQEHELHYWMAQNIYFSSLTHHFHPSPDVHCLENNFFIYVVIYCIMLCFWIEIPIYIIVSDIVSWSSLVIVNKLWSRFFFSWKLFCYLF